MIAERGKALHDPAHGALAATPGAYAAQLATRLTELGEAPVWSPWLYRAEWAAWAAGFKRLGLGPPLRLTVVLRSASLALPGSRFLFERAEYDRTLAALGELLLLVGRLGGAPPAPGPATLEARGLHVAGRGPRGEWSLLLGGGGTAGDELVLGASGDGGRELELTLRTDGASLRLQQGDKHSRQEVPPGEAPQARFRRLLARPPEAGAAHLPRAGELVQALQAAEDSLNQAVFEPTRAARQAASAPDWHGLPWRRHHPPLLHLDAARHAATWGSLRLEGARLLLIRAPNRDPGQRGPQLVLPLSIPSLAAFLQGHGAAVRQLDANALGHDLAPDQAEELAQRLWREARDSSWDLVGWSVDRPEDLPQARRLGQALKAHLPAPVVLGGRGVGGASLADLAEADFLVAEEGELPLLLLLAHVACGAPQPDSIPGLQYRTARGPNGNPAVEHALEVRPLPDFGPVAAQHRAAFPGHEPWFPYTYVQGCPCGCAYCSNFSDRRFQTHTTGRIVNDLNRLHADFGARLVYFLNNLINLRPGFLEGILDAWEARGPRLEWGDSARPTRFDPALFPRLKALGCRYLVWGIDAASPRLQKLMRKHLDLEQALELMRAGHAAGIENRINLIAGLPHETEADLRYGLDLLTRLRPVLTSVLLSRYGYASSSPVFREPERYGLIKRGDGFDERGGLAWEAKQRQIDDHVARLREHLRSLGLGVTG
jgi:hypothetical protein